MRVRYTPRAKLDLAEIYDYIARDNPHVARRVVSLIRREIKMLCDSPAIGRPGRIDGTRELVMGRYPFVVAYCTEPDEIQIVAVIHTAMQWPEVL